MNNQFTHPKERIRFAILTFFFAQGLCMYNPQNEMFATFQTKRYFIQNETSSKK